MKKMMKDHEILSYYLKKVLGTNKNRFGQSLHPDAKMNGNEHEHAEWLKKSAIVNSINKIVNEKMEEITPTVRENFEQKTGLNWADIVKEVQVHQKKVNGPGEDAQVIIEKNRQLQLQIAVCSAKHEQLKEDFNKLLERVSSQPFSKQQTA